MEPLIITDKIIKQCLHFVPETGHLKRFVRPELLTGALHSKQSWPSSHIIAPPRTGKVWVIFDSLDFQNEVILSSSLERHRLLIAIDEWAYSGRLIDPRKKHSEYNEIISLNEQIMTNTCTEFHLSPLCLLNVLKDWIDSKVFIISGLFIKPTLIQSKNIYSRQRHP